MKIVSSKKSFSYSQVKKNSLYNWDSRVGLIKSLEKNDSKTVEQFVPIGIVKEGGE